MIKNLFKLLFIVFLMLACFCISGVRANDVTRNQAIEKTFSDANFEYDNKQYDKAIQQYRKLIDSNIKNADLYFNLANTYFRKGQIGYALANYNNALKYEPRSADIKANMKFVMEQTQIFNDDSNMNPVLSILAFWYFNLNLFELIILTIIADVLVCVFFSVSFFYKNDILKIAKIIALFVLVILATSTIIKVIEDRNVDQAFIVRNDVIVKSGNGNDYSNLFNLNDGAELKVLDHKGGWYKIETLDDQKGWVNSNSIALVDALQ